MIHSSIAIIARRTVRLTGTTLVLSLALAKPASAQADPDSVHQVERCRLAAQVVTTGHPQPQELWAFGFVSHCGSVGAAALAQFVRTTADSSLLDRTLQASHLLQDATLFDALVTTATSPSSPVYARILSLRSLGYLFAPSALPTYGAYTASGGWDLPRACLVGAPMVSPAVPEVGTPLPGGYQLTIRTAALGIRADSSAPRDIRAAAYCLDLATRAAP